MNIRYICVKDKDVDQKRLQALIDELHSLGSYFWKNSEEFMSYTNDYGEGYTWLEDSGEYSWDLNGGELLPENFEVVDFDTWFDLAMETIKNV